MSSNIRLWTTLPWLISLAVASIAVVAWGQGLNWHLSGITTYQLFPVFGLLAFSLMWAHYAASAMRRLTGLNPSLLRRYFRLTSLAVLILIVLHPGLLEWQLWRDGFGLPPGSVLQHFVAPSLRLAAVVGMVSLLVFLAFELQRVFSTRHWWRYMRYASDAAMLAILYHSLKLGTQLQAGWMRGVWWFYAVVLVAAIAYNHAWDYRQKLSLVQMKSS